VTAAGVVIRIATAADAVALRRLAALDSAPPPVGPALIAEADGEPRGGGRRPARPGELRRRAPRAAAAGAA
jgi:hypothetical protein